MKFINPFDDLLLMEKEIESSSFEKEMEELEEVEEEEIKLPRKKELNRISNSDICHILELIKNEKPDKIPGFKNSIFVPAVQYLQKHYNGLLKDKLNLCKKIYNDGLENGVLLEEDTFIYG